VAELPQAEQEGMAVLFEGGKIELGILPAMPMCSLAA
jgi:hypothetical protein